MEIQAAVQMVSREVVAVPIPVVKEQRTIAIPITPSPSFTLQNLQDMTNPALDMAITKNEVDQEEIVISTTKPSKKLEPEISTVDLDYKFKLYKGSKSQDDIRLVKNETLLIWDLHLGNFPYSIKLHGGSRSKINKCNTLLIKNPRSCDNESKHNSKCCVYRPTLHDDNKEIESFKSYTKSFCTDFTPYRVSDEEEIGDLLTDWLDLIPLKQEESDSKKYDKEYIFYDFFDCLKYFVSNPFELNRRYKLKLDILDRLENLPVEVKGNKRSVLSRLADILINKVKHIGRKKMTRSAHSGRTAIKEYKDIHNTNFEGYYVPPTKSELKIFISSELVLCLEQNCLKINRLRIKDLEDDLLECFMFFIDEMRCGSDKRIKKNAVRILRNFGFSEYQAAQCANSMITHLRESFIHITLPPKLRSETFIVLPITHNNQCSRKCIAQNSKLSLVSNKKKDRLDLESYNNELCRQIQEWILSLKLQIPENRDNGYKKDIINELAGDIIDRQKYLELNPTSRRSDENELELLRYQIFKSVGKLVGEDDFIKKDHALQLMMRIKKLPALANSLDKNKSYWTTGPNIDNPHKIKKLSGNSRSDTNVNMQRSLPKLENEFEQNNNENDSLSLSVSTNSRDFNRMTASEAGSSKMAFAEEDNKIRQKQISKASSCFDLKNSTHEEKCVEQLEAEYQQFVKDWVQRVPIKIVSSDQVAIVERARIGLHNGLWKIVSKLNCDPATYYNRYFYENLLDDAIENLLDCLPQTPEMISMRRPLKEEFIEKTVNTYDQIRAHDDASFKNKLVRNVIANLRTHGIIDDNRDESIKQLEDIQIIKLVEEYLLYTRFKNDNKLISDVFKKQLSREIGDFVNDLKKNHNKELGHIDTASYKTEIKNVLEKLPLPSERAIKEEADDILLGIEVEQWFTDLPIVPGEDSINKFQRKIQLNMLAKNIKELQNTLSTDDSENALRNEITRFLEKTPLKEDERANTTFMVDELLNRIKNMQKQDISHIKGIVFQSPATYEEFGENVPFASSYIDASTSHQSPIVENEVTDSKLHEISKSEKACGSQHLIHQPPHPYNEQSSSYKGISEERPAYSSLNETADHWYTLQDSRVYIPKKNVQDNSQNTISSTSFVSHEYQPKRPLNSLENNVTKQNFFPNINYQRGISVKSQTQPIFQNKEPRIRFQEPSSIQYDSHGIKSSRDILGTSQVPGSSGYRTGQFESTPTYPSSSQIPNNVTNQSDIIATQTPESREIEQTNKYSKGIHTISNNSSQHLIPQPPHLYKNSCNEQLNNYRRASEEKPAYSSLKESPNQWHTSHDSQMYTPQKNVQETSQNSIASSSFAPRDYQTKTPINVVDNKMVNENYHPNIDYRRGILVKPQTQPFFENKEPGICMSREPLNIQKYSHEIKSNSDIIEVGQVPGPSGYSSSQSKSAQAYLINPSKAPNNEINQSGIKIKQTLEDRDINQSNKFSKGIQSSNGMIGTSQINLENSTKQLNATTNTSRGNIPGVEQPSNESTSKQNAVPKQNDNRKRPKWSMTEKEGIKGRFLDADADEDDYHCRCIERFWKCRRKPKYLGNEEFEDYPPCLPMFIPYPYFY